MDGKAETITPLSVVKHVKNGTSPANFLPDHSPDSRTQVPGHIARTNPVEHGLSDGLNYKA